MNSAETILNALSEPVLVLDETLCAVAANASFYSTLLIPQGVLKGKEVQELIAEDSAAPHLRAVLEAVATHKSDEEYLEVECDITPGVRKLLALTARRVRLGDDPSDLLLIELRDITRRDKAERKILELNTALQTYASELEVTNGDLESFTNSVSHDLRSPLRLTNKIAHLLLQEHGPELSVSAADKVRMILESTQEMGKLIEDLLAFSQMRHVPVKKSPVDMQRLAQMALTELQEEQEEPEGRDVSVTIDALPACQADRALMKQVFLNLLANALKFTRMCVKTEIHLGSNEVDGETVYFIRDNGVGFDKKHANAIFLPFHRLHRDKGFEGSGLGLALVKRVVDCHGGRIWPKSQRGHGTTMYFTLGAQDTGAPTDSNRKKTS